MFQFILQKKNKIFFFMLVCNWKGTFDKTVTGSVWEAAKIDSSACRYGKRKKKDVGKAEQLVADGLDLKWKSGGSELEVGENNGLYSRDVSKPAEVRV